MNFTTVLLIAIGGALGTLARYFISVATLPISQSLPLGTILINVVGSFIIGFFGTLTLATGRYPVAESTRLFVLVGFCGGFTTFSSFSLQTLDLLRGDAVGRAIANVVLSVMLCLMAVALGHLLASRLNGGEAPIAQLAVEEEV